MLIRAILPFWYWPRREHCVGETLLLRYDMIHSCGLKGVEIVSLCSLLRRAVPMQEVKKKTVVCFEEVFDLKTEPIPLSDLLTALSAFPLHHDPHSW